MIEREKLISLVQALRCGEEDAFTELYNTFHNDIYYHILKTTKEPELAADLTQDTFVEILQTVHKLEEPAAFVTWAKQIAYHRCTAYYRKRHELLADEDEDGYSVFDTVEEERGEFIPGEALDKEELKTAIRQIIDTLPMEQRSALMMRYFDEISVKEIAQIQGVSEGTVKSRLNYARKAVKDSVEKYETKHGIKLRCVGIVPLLLWLFRQYRRTSGAAGVIQTVSAATGAAGTAGAATAGTATTAATTGTASAAATASGGGLAAKIVATVVAVAVTAGGITTAVRILNKPEPEQDTVSTTAAPEPEQETVPTTAAPETEQDTVPTTAVPELVYPQTWAGYAEYFHSVRQNRYELLVTDMDETGIQGHLCVSILYGTKYETDLSGTGTENADGTITYTVELATPLVPSEFVDMAYSTMELVYDPETKAITLGDPLRAVIYPENLTEPVVLAEDSKWSGIGKDSLCVNYLAMQNHLFEVQVEKMTDSTIEGRLVVSKDGNVEHDTAFTGRGFLLNDVYWYEVAVEETRTTEWIVTNTVDYFWMKYHTKTDTLELDGLYDAETFRIE